MCLGKDREELQVWGSTGSVGEVGVDFRYRRGCSESMSTHAGSVDVVRRGDMNGSAR